MRKILLSLFENKKKKEKNSILIYERRESRKTRLSNELKRNSMFEYTKQKKNQRGNKNFVQIHRKKFFTLPAECLASKVIQK